MFVSVALFVWCGGRHFRLLPDAVIGVTVTVGVAHEPLPVQPAHGGFQRQAVVQRFGGGADEGDEAEDKHAVQHCRP